MSLVARMTSMGGGAAFDPNFGSVSLLLQGDNTGSPSTFLDSSSNHFSVTRNGSATQVSSSPYGSGGSLSFNGSTDYLTVASNSAFAFGTGPWTIEFWINLADLPFTVPFLSIGSLSDGFALVSIFYGELLCYTQDDGFQSLFPYLSTGSWTHLAFSCNRDGGEGSIYMYVNGSFAGSNQITTNLTGSNVSIGHAPLFSSTDYFNGKIEDLRITKGVARYFGTAGFTPPTKPYPAQ